MWFKTETYELPSIEEINMITKENAIIRKAKEKILNEKWTNKAIGKIAKQIRKAAQKGVSFISVRLSCPDYAAPDMLNEKIKAAGYKSVCIASFEGGFIYYIDWNQQK